MLEHIMTNEQKLEEIYQILKAQEARLARARLFRILKWMFIFVVVFIIIKNPSIILNSLTELIMPVIMDNMKTMMEQDSANIMQQFKNLIPQQ